MSGFKAGEADSSLGPSADSDVAEFSGRVTEFEFGVVTGGLCVFGTAGALGIASAWPDAPEPSAVSGCGGKGFEALKVLVGMFLGAGRVYTVGN